MNQEAGKYLMITGLVIALIGVILYFFHNKFQWFGKLPGDIRVDKNSFIFYFPFTTMLLVSLLITLLINIFRRL